MNGPHVWVVFVESSDQSGKTELVGVFSHPELASQASASFVTRRTIIEILPLDRLREGADRWR